MLVDLSLGSGAELNAFLSTCSAEHLAKAAGTCKLMGVYMYTCTYVIVPPVRMSACIVLCVCACCVGSGACAHAPLTINLC